MQLTPAEFRAEHNLSAGQFKRLKSALASQHPDTDVTIRRGNKWFVTEAGQQLLLAALPDQSGDQSRPVDPTSRSQSQTIEPTSALTSRQPVELVQAELVPEVQELQIILPNHATDIARAQLEIRNTANIASGNRHLKRALRRKALIEAAQAEAIEDFALADKAYEGTLAALEQQQLNQLGIGLNASTSAETPDPAKK